MSVWHLAVQVVHENSSGPNAMSFISNPANIDRTIGIPQAEPICEDDQINVLIYYGPMPPLFVLNDNQ